MYQSQDREAHQLCVQTRVAPSTTHPSFDSMPEFLLERRLEVLLASLTDVAYVPHLSDL